MLQMPLLNLDLDVRENGEIKPVSIEMNKEELQNLINALEAANKVSFTDVFSSWVLVNLLVWDLWVTMKFSVRWMC